MRVEARRPELRAEAIPLVDLSDRPLERVHDRVVEERLVQVTPRYEVERALAARRTGDGDADELLVACDEAQLRGVRRLQAALGRAPERPGPLAPSQAVGSGLRELVPEVAGDAPGHRIPERHREGARQRGVVELVVRRQRRVLAAADRAGVDDLEHGRVHRPRQPLDRQERRERHGHVVNRLDRTPKREAVSECVPHDTKVSEGADVVMRAQTPSRCSPVRVTGAGRVRPHW